MLRAASQRAVPGYGRARRVQQHEALRVRAAAARQPAVPARWACASAPCMPDGEHQIGLADRLLRPGRELVVGEEEHVVVGALQRVERPRRLGAVERRIARGSTRAGHLGAQQHACDAWLRTHSTRRSTKASGSSLAPARMSAMVRGRGSGGGAVLTLAVGHAPCQRHGQRAPDRRALRRQRFELGAPQPQHQAVAQRGDGGGARAAGQERDLADRLAGAHLGHHVARGLRAVTAKRPVTTT